MPQNISKKYSLKSLDTASTTELNKQMKNRECKNFGYQNYLKTNIPSLPCGKLIPCFKNTEYQSVN